MAAFSAQDMKRIEQEHFGSNVVIPLESRNTERLAEAAAGLDNNAKATSPVVFGGMVRLVEFCLIALTGLIVQHLYVYTQEPGNLFYYGAILLIASLAVIVFQSLGLYQIFAFRSPISFGLRLAGGWALVFLLAMGTDFLFKIEGTFSRFWLLSWFGFGVVALSLERLIVATIVRSLTRRGKFDRRTVVVGGGEACEQLLNELSDQKDTGLRIYGVFDDRNDMRTPDLVGGFPKLGNIDDLVEFARLTRVDLVIFTLPISAERRLLQMLRKLWVLPIDIRLAAHMNKLRFRPRSYSYIGNVPVLDVFDKPIADWDIVLKLAFDKVVGAICLILLSPIMVLIALGVKLTSKGPILFKQKRHGFNNEVIEVYKFRSMYTHLSDFTASKQVSRNDPRVTPFGRIIRKTSLDELPQLFNVVFKGDLSLVGPRPHAISARADNLLYDEVVDGYFARHRVRPGITGWAQINGWRGETDTQEKIQGRIECDLYYIENWSILFDLYILLITPLALLKTENAY